ncbi:MAG: hypothetical protein ACTS2F_00875 [Thainema sp.]
MADADQHKPYIQEGEAIWAQIKNIEHQIQQAESELARTRAEIEIKQQHLQQKNHELEVGQQKLDNLKQQFRDLLQCQTPQPLADGSSSSPGTADDRTNHTSEPSAPRLSNGHSNYSSTDNQSPDNHLTDDHSTDQQADSANDSAQTREPNSLSNSTSFHANGHGISPDDSDNADVVDRPTPTEESRADSTYHFRGDEISVPSEQLNPETLQSDPKTWKRAYREPHDETDSLSNQNLELDQAAIWAVLERMIGSILAIAALLLGVLGIVMVLGGSTEALLLVASGVLIGIASGLLLSPSLPLPWRFLWTQLQAIRDRTRPNQPQKTRSTKRDRRNQSR